MVCLSVSLSFITTDGHTHASKQANNKAMLEWMDRVHRKVVMRMLMGSLCVDSSSVGGTEKP